MFRKIKKKTALNLLLNLFLVCSLLFIASCDSSVFIKNMGQDNTYIKLQKGQLSAGPLAGDENSGLWDVEIVDTNHIRLKKHGTNNQYLHVKNGPLECSEIPATDTSTHWKMSNQDSNSNFKLESRTRQGHVLYVEKNRLMLSDAVMGEKTQFAAVSKKNLKDAVNGPSQKLTKEQEENVKTFLGKGYHAEESYADMASSTVSLFDLDQLVKTAVPLDASEYKGHKVYGSSIQKYSDNLAASISIDAKVGLFSGGIKSSFSTSSSKSTNDSYCTIHDVIGYYRLDMDPEKVPLIGSVKNDIDNLDPMELIQKYGTHYIQSAYVGARISYNTSIDHSVFTSEQDFKVSVNAAYEAFSASASLDAGNKKYNEQSSENSTVEVFGGDPGLANVLKGIGNEDKSKTYNNWEKTIQKYMTLADFGQNGLRPISELASNPSRQKQLLDSITAYLKSKGIKLPEAKPRVMKNSIVMIQSTDGRYVTRPLFRQLAQVYYPEVWTSESYNGFRIIGHYTFDKLSTDPLNSNNMVSITFDETELWPGWQDGKPIKEVNQEWYKNKYLKLGGGTLLETPFAHFTEPSAWTNWNIKKVGGSDGDPIYSGDKVQIYSGAVDKYLNPEESGTLWVNSNTETTKNFVWKIIVVDPK